MTDRLCAGNRQPSLLFVLVDSAAFWIRNQTVFWIAALPIAGLGAGIAYVLEADQKLSQYRNHWGWDFLFALIYAMFLDRWIKETLLDGASPCEEVDTFRRSTVAVRSLILAMALFVLAMALSIFQLEGIVATLERWHIAHAPAVVAGTVLTWLPHLFLWAMIFASFALILPALSAAKPLNARRTLRLGRPVGGSLFALIFGAALLSLSAWAATVWGLEVLPKKPWATAAMAAAWRLFDCLLLTFVAFGLATFWRQLTDWQQPEPEDHPYRGMRIRLPKSN